MFANRRGVSYAVSAVIMTATILVLVLVSGTYTYQVLEQQRAAAEFEVAKKSILSFDDALENIAWKPYGARSARFTIDYGQLELVPNRQMIINVTGYENATYSLGTGQIKYGIETKYVTFGENYSTYLLGDSKAISNGTGSYGRILAQQNPGWVTLTLSYGVRAMKTSLLNVTQDDQPVLINYVDIWIVKVNVTEWSSYIGDFDLTARCVNVQTIPTNTYDILEGDRQLNITVKLEDEPLSSTAIRLDDSAEKVVFNFIVATVQVNA